MEPIIFDALLEEATRQGVIDPDILTCYPEQVKGVKLGADGKPDIGTVVNAIRAIKQKSPALFKTQDFEQMDPAQYQDAESKFREKLQRHARPAARNNDFRDLDAALLSETEAHALRRHLSGTRSSYDKSILEQALRRQNGPDAA